MDNFKTILIGLLNKYMDTLTTSHEYVLCHSLVKKINDFVVEDKDSGIIKINYDNLTTITDEEVLMFSSPECIKIIQSFSFVKKIKGITDESILKNINKLKDDLINHRLEAFHVQEKSLDTILGIIEHEDYKENYRLILEFIKMSFDSGLIDTKTAIDLNFYILKKCNDYKLELENEESLEVVILEENSDPIVDLRKKLEQVFSKYGYIYDRKLLDKCGGEEYFVKYAKIEYVDYVLAKFKKYGITQEDLYAKKTFYNIIIDKDKQVFNSILDFIDHNDCTLKKLLYLPSVFARRKREYVMKDNKGSNKSKIEKSFKICGCNGDFFKNIKLYKKLRGINDINDTDLDAIGKYLSTPHSLIEKNMSLLLKFGILTPDKLPDSIVSLCGRRTEYLIDRFIEASLFSAYLLPRVMDDGKVIPSVGTSRLFLMTTDLMFYKIKRALDVGDSILHSNGGLRRNFSDDNFTYMGIELDRDTRKIIQKPMTMEEIDKIDLSRKKYLPGKLYPRNNDSWDIVAKLEFNNLYKYNIYSPVSIFGNDLIKGKLYERIFEEDFKEDVSSLDVLNDEIIQMLDNAVYYDVYGNSYSLKTSDYQYEFFHPSYPNMHIIISRYKVLRLCKLLCDNDCWINNASSFMDKENSLLSVILKDTIICDYEMSMVRFVVREILKNGFVKVNNDLRDGRGAR